MLKDIKAVPPGELAGARRMAHMGAHLLTKSARANLPARADHSHSALFWNRDQWRLETQPAAAAQRVALSFDPFELQVLDDARVSARLALDGQSLDAAKAWLDEQQTSAGLAPSARQRVPYKVDPAVMAITEFELPAPEHLRALAAWFSLTAAKLDSVVSELSTLDPGPSPVWCWPHHFDLSTYIALEHGDPETARGIGVGLSAGDGYYDEPYLYVNPWPTPDAQSIAQAPSPGHLHMTDFV